jgi:16S rRNA G1207 methylase RsmC
MKHVDYYNKLLIKQLDSPRIIVDATVGNGNDALRLAQEFPESLIFGFDIQEKALKSTEELLKQNNISNVKLILDSHSNIHSYVMEPIDLVVFNLGYLPRSDKELHTRSKDTISAIESCLARLTGNGLIMITAYPGSIRGEVEDIDLQNFICSLDQLFWDVTMIQMMNQRKKPPVLYIIHKK